jgi:hypothetical protein
MLNRLAGRLRQLALQPGLAKAEVAADGLDGYVQKFRRFLSRETAKEAHLNDPGFTRVLFFQLTERAIQIEKGVRAGIARLSGILKSHFDVAAATFAGIPHAGMVHQDLAHELGGDAEKVCPAAVVRLILTDQPHIRFMDEGGRLESMVSPLPAQVAVGETAQLPIGKRDQLVRRGLVTLFNLPEKLSQRRRVHYTQY